MLALNQSGLFFSRNVIIILLRRYGTMKEKNHRLMSRSVSHILKKTCKKTRHQCMVTALYCISLCNVCMAHKLVLAKCVCLMKKNHVTVTYIGHPEFCYVYLKIFKSQLKIATKFMFVVNWSDMNSLHCVKCYMMKIYNQDTS